MNYIRLASNIKKLRKKKHMTQEALAEAVNCSTVFISQIETGVRVPGFETIYKLSEVFDCGIDALVYGGSKDKKGYITEISRLFDNHTETEIEFAIDILRELLSSIKNDKIIRKKRSSDLDKIKK